MIERALRGDRTYWSWLALLGLGVAGAGAMFLYQDRVGLGVTAMGRDVPWAFYIAQLTFLVGVAASAVMVVLPYYLHDEKAFGRITVLGEFLAIPACLVAMLFVGVDMGQPRRLMNMLLHPTLNSPMFWDFIALAGYMCLNAVIGWKALLAEKQGVAVERWVRVLAYVSIPWAVSIHTVTAFLYAGLAARPYWMTAVMAPRFLASAFAAGPALLVLLCLVVRRVTRFDPGVGAIRKLGVIVTYAMLVNLFLLGMEVFTALYSGMEEHIVHFRYLYAGIDGEVASVVPFMWASAAMAVAAVVILLVPRARRDLRWLAAACVLVFVSIWIDKGAGMMTGGLMPTPTHHTVDYFPSWVEIVMGIGLYSLGALVLTALYKVAVSIKLEH